MVGIAFLVIMMGATLPTPLYPEYADRLGFGEFTVTLVFAAYAVGVTGGLLLLGHWSDQVGRRPMVVAGLVVSALSAVCFLMPLSLGWLYVGRVLSGLSAGIFTGTATAYVVDLAPQRQAARASLLAAGVNMAGLGLGPVLTGLLVVLAPAPTRLTYVVDLVLIGIGLVLVLLVAETVPRAQHLRLGPRTLGVPAEARAVFVRSAIAGFAGFAVLGLFTAVSPAFLAEVLDRDSPALVGLVVAILFGASVVGQVISTGRRPDRALPVGCVLLVLGMVGVGAALPLASLALLGGGAAVAGVGQGMSFRAGLAGVTSASPEHQRGAVTSTFFVTLYVGISFPVIGEGALAAVAGLRVAGVVFSVVVALLAAAALVLVLRQQRAAGT